MLNRFPIKNLKMNIVNKHYYHNSYRNLSKLDINLHYLHFIFSSVNVILFTSILWGFESYKKMAELRINLNHIWFVCKNRLNDDDIKILFKNNNNN